MKLTCSTKRVCYNCGDHIPPQTEHYEIHDQVYCKSCVEEVPYTAYSYYVDGEYLGDSEDGYSRRVESYEDEYEEEEPYIATESTVYGIDCRDGRCKM